MQPSAAEVITARNVDLTSCDRELIQFPDAIQPHGVMLTVDEASNCIVHASANCAEALGAGPEQILGKSAAHVLGRDGHDLLGPLHRMTLDSGPAHLARESFVGSDRGYHLFAHRSGGLVILELEIAKNSSAQKSSADPPAKLYSDLRADITRLQATRNLAAFFDLAVQRIRDFTGYDRVMAYRFDEDGSGEVVAEARRDGLEAYLALHYPASDIPLPARRLFALSWLRHLPDVDYVPVPLVAASEAALSGPVDMSYAALRSVSVMYTDYLKNMGVRSTMVMPLMKEGRLWGLVSAMHHQGPRHIPHETRMAAEFLAHTLSLLMSAKEDTDLFERVLAMRAATDRLTQSLTLASDFEAALSSPETLKSLLGLVEAGAATVVCGDRIALAGKTPTEPQVRDLAHWLAKQDGPLFATDRLSVLYPAGESFADVASGALAIRCGSHLIVWFRPEQIANVDWAGDPHKPVDVVESEGTVRLRPRGSFALWKESVRHRSTRWRDDERDAALRLRQGLDKALERVRAGPEPSLEAFRVETDVFAQGLSQELKEQARGIYHLTTLLRRRQSEALDAEGRQQIATILRMTQRVDGLADALMRHARIGHGALDVGEVDLDALVDEALRDLAGAASGIEVRRPSRLGRALCNRAWIAEVFVALIDNAMRYNDKPSKWIEIGALPGPPTRYYVRDNGLGVAAADAERVFKMFHRLHEHSDYGGGAGIGLAFARKIVERHGGQLWLDSTPGAGSTFTFTLAAEG